MIKWTTPTLAITIPSDLMFDYLILTLKGAKATYDKRVEYSEVTEGQFEVTLSQEETGTFMSGERVEAQINFFYDEKRIATYPQMLYVTKNLLNKAV